MNTLFKKLAIEKQLRIINAGLDVFSKHAFKDALTEDVANKAGIAKGSLFQYFKNKRTFYLYLYEYAIEQLKKKVDDQFDFEETDFFKIIEKGMMLKLKLLREYPYLYNFVIQANNEEDEWLASAIIEKNKKSEADMMARLLKNMDRYKFKEGTDITTLIKRINWCGEGLRQEGLALAKSYEDMVAEGLDLIDFFKKAVYLEEYL